MKELFLRSHLGISLALIFSLSIYSQEDFNPKAFFIEAESYFLFEEYSEALPLYHRILREEPENYNVKYKLGICYLNDVYQKSRSIKYLEEASNHISLAYKSNTFKEKLAPPEVNYYLAQAYRVNGQLDKAIEYYKLFKKSVDPNVFNLDVVNAELASCKVAKETLKSPVYSKEINLGTDINSRFAEINPVLSGDGKTLIFTRKLQFYDAIFITELGSDGKWSPPYNLTPEFGLDGNSYTTGISYHGDEIFVYRSDNFDGNIYSSKKVNGRWGTLKKLNNNINTKYWESHACISPDGKYLYFTSNRKGGYGGLDIYRSMRDVDGAWGFPVNLGPVVNSSYNEETPFISPTDDKLYFSSLGHGGMGGYDIFVSERMDSETWSSPTNMGYPLNTTDDDLFYCSISKDGKTGLHSRYYQRDSYGLKDIYWVEVYNAVIPREYTLKGAVNTPSPKILDSRSLTATLIDAKTGKIASQTKIDSLGNFTLPAHQGDYKLLVDGEGIQPVSVPVELELTQENQIVDLALITTTASEAGDAAGVVPLAELPKLSVAGEQYIVTDSVPVTINLNVEKGSELKIETFVANKLIATEDYHLSKGKFTYVATNPQPGENRIVFTVTDEDGIVNQKEVLVYYTPKIIEEESIAGAEVDQVDTELAEVAKIATGGLQSYLLTLGDVNYSTKGELYEMLTANAADNNYSQEDVDALFALMLTQRNKDEFLAEISETPEFAERMLADSILNKLEMPLAIVNESKIEFKEDQIELNNGLISVLPYSGSPDAELAYILSFENRAKSVVDSKLADKKSAIKSTNLSDLASEEAAGAAIDLASTTQLLDYYYQNLYVSSDGALRDLLVGIDFEENNIENSIDLVAYLFEKAPESGISKSELVSVLEKSQNEKQKNLFEFKEAIANAATGELKSAIQEVSLIDENVANFEDLIDILLRNANTSGYGRLEVYDLLVKMIGIENIEEFANTLKEYANSEMDSALISMDIKEFSKPIELVQYLLANTANFDYSDSDINNLLLRMLLEKGIDNYSLSEQSLQSEKLINRQRSIATIALASALLILLIIIFLRRKKKKESK